MEFVANLFRSFCNLLASGIALLIGIAALASALDLPADSPGWKKDGPLGALVVLAAAAFCAFMARGLYRQGNGRSSWIASAYLFGLAGMALLAVVVIWAMRHY
ncbi:hypothetical protein DVT68_18240 [Dyella solisilvae]|uniref:DUF202 domain-containing protein n=1 Tax=Dyella solisilvae TaxID=1920168 RepID=A0A370K2Z3_9GAMM|nr:hypothetical protein [Dyella solisilvae]RDI97033.1 hypothetical protein DVT68_18240 [Dyella solisilvae]